MHGIWLALFAIVTGFTASGIVANLYRLSGVTGNTVNGRTVRMIVMVVAGPSVVFEHAMKGLMAKEWSPVIFWLVTGVMMYWSLAIGLFVLDVAMHL
jgi:hypothetical protein